jgi:hypothetical protein
MALKDMQSQYGPFNKLGKRGTGEAFDTLANEGTSGLEGGSSKYGPFNKLGKQGTGEVFDTLAFEGKKNLGVEGARSKYGPLQKPGTPEQDTIEMDI